MAFPETRLSIVDALRGPDPARRDEAFARLAESYWRPVYTYLRLRWRLDPADAEDAAQGFFAHVLEKDTLASFDPARARLRTWLRACLDAFAVNRHAAATARRRGGGVRHVAIDAAAAESDIGRLPAAGETDPEALFHREWMRALFAACVDELRAFSAAAGRETDFAIFERYDLADVDDGARPSYAALAGELGVPVTKVTNALHAMRRRLREVVVARLRASCAGEAEVRAELGALFGPGAAGAGGAAGSPRNGGRR